MLKLLIICNAGASAEGLIALVVVLSIIIVIVLVVAVSFQVKRRHKATYDPHQQDFAMQSYTRF